jgi:hypothetical protein
MAREIKRYYVVDLHNYSGFDTLEAAKEDMKTDVVNRIYGTEPFHIVEVVGRIDVEETHFTPFAVYPSGKTE